MEAPRVTVSEGPDGIITRYQAETCGRCKGRTWIRYRERECVCDECDGWGEVFRVVSLVVAKAKSH